VFVSYSWKLEEETKIIEKLKVPCENRGITLVLDRETLKHGDSIKQFMDDLTSGKHVITVFSDPYFRSPWCMYELLRLYQRGEFAERTHAFIASDDCNIHSIDYRLELVNYWKEKHRSEAEKLKGYDAQYVIKEYEQLKIYEEIQLNINEIVNFAKDRVTTSLTELENTDYAQLLDRINRPLPRQPPDNDPTTLSPDIVAAWINRKQQWEKHIIERIKTKDNPEKSLAFIISGVKEEWPEGLILRIKCYFRIPPKRHTELQPNFSGKFKGRREYGLWFSILEKILPHKIDIENLELNRLEDTLVRELSNSPESNCFFWTIDKGAKEQLNCDFLKFLAERWETLALKDAAKAHYLIIIYGYEPMKWHRGGKRKITSWHRNMKKNLDERDDNPKMLVPALTPATKADLDEWFNEFHADKSETEREKLDKAIRKKMWWGKATHLTLKNTYLETVKSSSTGQQP
jgi:TIR domain